MCTSFVLFFFMHFLDGYMYPPRQLVLSTALLAYHFNFPGKLLCCHYILSSFLYLFQEEMLLLLTVESLLLCINAPRKMANIPIHELLLMILGFLYKRTNLTPLPPPPLVYSKEQYSLQMNARSAYPLSIYYCV